VLQIKTRLLLGKDAFELGEGPARIILVDLLPSLQLVHLLLCQVQLLLLEQLPGSQLRLGLFQLPPPQQLDGTSSCGLRGPLALGLDASIDPVLPFAEA